MATDLQPEELVREGRLDEALSALQERIRRNASDAKLRTFLFQLLAVRGDWERALNQLAVVGELDAAALPMVQTYREALNCEALRAHVYSGERTPLMFGEPAEWAALLVEGLRAAARGEAAAAGAFRDRAFEAAPASAGAIDGQRFEWIADADTRLGPVLEAVINGRYCWIPFANIRRIEFHAPEDLRDMVWLPAEFTWTNEGQSVGLVPVRYPGSEGSAESAIRLARRTEWTDHGHGLYTGLGQKMYATDAGEYPLLEIRRIDFDAGPAAAADTV